MWLQDKLDAREQKVMMKGKMDAMLVFEALRGSVERENSWCTRSCPHYW